MAKESGMRPALVPYWALIEAFVQGRLRPAEFESIYLGLYLNDPTMWSQDLFDILDRLFGVVEDYYADPSLREDDDPDGEQLKRSAQRALDELKKATAD